MKEIVKEKVSQNLLMKEIVKVKENQNPLQTIQKATIVAVIMMVVKVQMMELLKMAWPNTIDK